MRRRDLGLLLLALPWASAIGSIRATGSGPVRIGVSLGLTGQYRVPSEMNRRGYELWQDDVNAKDGLLGQKVELVMVDDQSNASRAAAIYRDFVSSNAIDQLFGPYSSELMSVVAPIVDAAGFPLLAAGASADELWRRGYRNLFAMLTPASRYTQGMLRLAREAELSTIAIISADDAFSTAIANGTVKWASYLQLKPVLQLMFPTAAVDLEGPMRQARDANADLLIVAGHRDETINARRAAANLGWPPRNFYATIGPALPEWHDELGESANGAFSTSIWEPTDSLAYPGAAAFAVAFRQRFGIEPSYHAATAYAAGQILLAAVAAAGSLEHDAIRNVLYGLDTYSILGRFAVDHTGMQVKRIEMIIQWQRDRKEIVWPPEIRTAEPIIDQGSP
jgi:branched-chain amino acid transport system substrate-binding protein